MDFIDIFQIGANWSVMDFPQELYVAFAVGLVGYGVVYAMQTVTLYTIGKREGYGKHIWMAFVPFFNTYYMGVVSEKNRIFNKKPKYFSLALAIIEFIIFVGWVLYYVSFYALRGTGYINYELYEYLSGVSYYTPVLSTSVPASMAWMGWCFEYLYNIVYYSELVYVLIRVFVLISFFQTYAHGRYFIMALFSAIFPIAGIIMFFVRKNRAMNYREYIRMVQERQYRQYQQNQRYGNPYNYNPYNGNPNNYNNPNNNPNYNNNNAANDAAGDPFEDLNTAPDGTKESPSSGNTPSGGSSNDDPFEDF